MTDRCLAETSNRSLLRFPVLLQALSLPPLLIPQQRTLMTFKDSTRPTQNAGTDKTVRLQRISDREPVRFVSEASTCPSLFASGRCSRDDGRRMWMFPRLPGLPRTARRRSVAVQSKLWGQSHQSLSGQASPQLQLSPTKQAPESASLEELSRTRELAVAAGQRLVSTIRAFSEEKTRLKSPIRHPRPKPGVLESEPMSQMDRPTGFP